MCVTCYMQKLTVWPGKSILRRACLFVCLSLSFSVYLSLYLSFLSWLWLPWHFPKVAARHGTPFGFYKTNPPIINPKFCGCVKKKANIRYVQYIIYHAVPFALKRTHEIRNIGQKLILWNFRWYCRQRGTAASSATEFFCLVRATRWFDTRYSF